ncbi:MAG: hypothetical protein SGARI_002308 [Bacillariaceae sp.]
MNELLLPGKKPRIPESACGAPLTPILEADSALNTPKPNPRMFASPDTSKALVQEDKIDKFIAHALNNMSIQEREHTVHEMHGVQEEQIQETPELLSSKFQELSYKLRAKIQSLPSDSALRIVSERSPQFLQDPKFQLMFLRSDLFDVDKTVTRLVHHFELKKHLFGQEKLGKTITLGDLSKDDRASLDSGFFSVLPVRDRAGRAILHSMHRHKVYSVVENLTRALYYVMMAALEDDETQRKGITVVLYAVHTGSGFECVYAMMTYGIPTDVMPINMVDGMDMKRKNFVQFLRMRKQQEATMSYRNGRTHVVVPTNQDILFGRGKKYREHYGNMKMNITLESYIELYESVGIKEKSNVIADVTRKLMNDGARFLKLEGDVWMPVEEKLARAKVSHCFRTRIRIQGSSTKESSATRQDNLCVGKANNSGNSSSETKRARSADE